MVMTPKEFTEEMRKIQNETDGDEEAIHGKMDELMCKVLKELGYGDGVDIFEGQTKWYA
jgi:hypothetical protein